MGLLILALRQLQHITLTQVIVKRSRFIITLEAARHTDISNLPHSIPACNHLFQFWWLHVATLQEYALQLCLGAIGWL